MAKQERNPQRGGRQPITRHPLFPAIVALWFAALFGLGSVLPSAATMERVVAASGLAKTIPMAAPPLGTTARLLIALGLTGIGGLVGALIGLRLSARNAPRAKAMHDLTGGAFEDTDEAEPADGRLPSRRRGFVAPAEATDQGEPEPFAAPESPAAPAPASGIFQLSDLDDDDFDPHSLAARDSTIKPTESEISYIEDEHAAPAYLVDAFSPAAWADPAHTPPALALDVGDDEEEDEEAPVSRLFETYTRTLEAREARAPAMDEAEYAPIVEQPAEMAPVADTPPASPAAERIAAAHLDDLSHVELLERLAMAMEEQRRKLALAQGTPLSVVPFAAKVAGEPEAVEVHPASPEAEPIDESKAGSDSSTPAALPITPILQRLSSLGTTAPFAPPPFAPPPFGSRQTYAATEADDEPVQPVEDFVSNAPTEANAIGGWFDRDEFDRAKCDRAKCDRDEASSEAMPQVEAGEQPHAEPIAPAHIPAALRPVGTTAFDEDDAVPGYIPPRRIAMPAAPEVTTETPHNPGDRPMAGLAGGHDFAVNEEQDEDETLAAFADEEEFADDGEDIVDEGLLDEGYSSLLSLQCRTEPRHGLISMEEEAAPACGEAADVIARDGSEEHAGSAPDEAAPAFAQPPLPSARLFDPPGRPDPAETEKALRAALATLQRMSGTA